MLTCDVVSNLLRKLPLALALSWLDWYVLLNFLLQKSLTNWIGTFRPQSHIYCTVTSHRVHIGRLYSGSVRYFFQDLLKKWIQWPTCCACSKVTCRLLNTFSWVWFWQIESCYATVEGFLNHIIWYFATAIEDLFCRAIVSVNIRVCQLLVFSWTDIILQLRCRLLLIGARIDPVEIYARKGRCAIDVLNLEGLLCCAVEQKQWIVEFLLVGGKMLERGRRFWPTCSMSGSVCFCGLDHCCLTHIQAVIITHGVLSLVLYSCETLSSTVIIALICGHGLSNLGLGLLVRRVRR